MLAKTKELLNWLKQQWSNALFMSELDFNPDPTWFEIHAPHKIVALQTLFVYWWWDFKAWWLCRNGHDWEDQSDISNAKDGSFDMECKRCGWHSHGYW